MKRPACNQVEKIYGSMHTKKYGAPVDAASSDTIVYFNLEIQSL